MRSTILSLVMSSTLLLCCNAMTAQQSSQPSQELQHLTKALTGEWSLSVKFEPTASMPDGLTNMGTETWRAGPGGFTLLEEEHLRMPKRGCLPPGRHMVGCAGEKLPRNGVPKPASVYL
jgi:hypothetical protein